MSMSNWIPVGQMGFFILNHEDSSWFQVKKPIPWLRRGILHIEEYFGDTFCNLLQHITLHFSELQLIKVLLVESERERMWQSSHTRLISLSPALYSYFLLLSFKLKPQNFRDSLTKEWFWRMMVLMCDFDFQLFPLYQKFCCALLIYGAFHEMTFQKLLANFGVLKSIANISGLTALARYRSGARFLEGCDL